MIFVRDNLLTWVTDSIESIESTIKKFTDKLVDVNLVDFSTTFNWNAAEVSRYAAEGAEYHHFRNTLNKLPPLPEEQLIAGLTASVTRSLMNLATDTSESSNPMRALEHRGKLAAFANLREALEQVASGDARLLPKDFVALEPLK